MSILNHVPCGYEVRPQQRKALLEVEANWDRTDVFVIPGPVAMGKSLLATTIAAWRKEKVAILTPQVLLQRQYEDKPPYYPVLAGKARYECSNEQYSNCGEHHLERDKTYCLGCPYVEKRDSALAARVAVYNFHSYTYNKVKAEVVIVDEAHDLKDFLSDLYTVHLWQHLCHYPDDIDSRLDLVIWIEQFCKKLTKLQAKELKNHEFNRADRYGKQIAKLKKMLEYAHQVPSPFLITHEIGEYRGRKKPFIKIQPISMAPFKHRLRPHGDQKLILMSATIKDFDIKDLGLDHKKVTYLACDSAIPARQRPFYSVGTVSMTRKHQSKSIPVVADQIAEIADHYDTVKGLVHLPYGLIGQFQKHLTGPRFLWHNKKNKDEMFSKFTDSTDPVILMAGGMSQGIDLAGPDYGFQVVTKVMWPSLMDPLIKKLSVENDQWYKWQAAKIMIQMYGRICRTPNDRGDTIMLDQSFAWFYRKNPGLWPDWFKEAVKWKIT